MTSSSAPPAATADPADGTRRRRWRRWTVVLSLLLVLVAGEIGARLVTASWTGREMGARLDRGPVIGMYTTHPRLPYVLAVRGGAPVDGRLDKEFRGIDVVPPKRDGVARIVCVGASTTFGLYVRPEKAFPAALEARLVAAGTPAEVFNAGVPGWIAQEVRTNLEHRVLRYRPDVVIVHCGRNEVFPQVFDDFRADGSHYRIPGHDFTQVGALHKRLFRVSRLAMVLCSWRGNRFGWDTRAAHPIYGSIDFTHQPTTDEVIARVDDPERASAYADQLRAMVRLCRAAGAQVVFAPVPVLPDRFRTNNLEPDPRLNAPFGRRVAANDVLMREVAAELDVPFVDLSALTDDPDRFHDDCHVDAEGHARKAEILAGVVGPLLRE